MKCIFVLNLMFFVYYKLQYDHNVFSEKQNLKIKNLNK